MHVMIDLETMGTSADAPIVTIGACRFDTDGVKEDTFYRKISLKSALDSGSVLDADTVVWWMGQSDDARQEAVSGAGDLLDVLGWFSTWIGETEYLEGVWGNGAAFDNAIIAQSYRRIGREAPWPFWMDRCYRTVKAFSDIPITREGTHHNALDDAITQAKHLIAIWANQQSQEQPQ